MTTLLHFEDKVHRKGLARAESLPLLMPRLFSQVLEHLGFPEEPRIERRIRCPRVLTKEQAMVIPISFLLHSRTRRRYWMRRQRTPRGEMIQFPRWRQRWRGAQCQIYLLHLLLHLPQPQPLLTLPAHHIQRSIFRSTFMSVRGSY